MNGQIYENDTSFPNKRSVVLNIICPEMLIISGCWFGSCKTAPTNPAVEDFLSIFLEYN